MWNNYIFGSQGLGLKNTFKLDGILYAVNGTITFIIGAYLLLFFGDKAIELNLEYNTAQTIAVVKIVGGAYLIFLSVYLFSIGVRKIFCDIESADVPADLTKYDTYSPDQLIEILKKGKVPYKKNSGFLEEFTNSILKNFKYISLPIRTITQNIFNGFFQILFLLFLYCIASLSGLSFHPVVKSWIEFLLLLWTVSILLKYRPRKNRKAAIIKKRMNIRSLAFYICVAFIGPIFLSQIYAVGYLPELPEGGQQIWLSVVVVFIIYTASISFMFVWLRDDNFFAIHAVDFKKKFTVKASPNDIYLGFEDAITELEYKKNGATWPNRIYLDEAPVVDKNKKFVARKLVESQPISDSTRKPGDEKHFILFYRLKVITTITVHLLILSSVVWFFGNFFMFGTVSYDIFLKQLFFTIKAPTIFMIFTYLLNKISFYYWGEFLFTSELTLFEIKGTYYKSIEQHLPYEQQAKPNSLLYSGQSVFTMRIYSATVSSTTFFDAKNKQLNGPRYLTCMGKNDRYVDSLLNALTRHTPIANEYQVEYKVNSQQHELNSSTHKQIQPIPAQPHIQPITSVHDTSLQLHGQTTYKQKAINQTILGNNESKNAKDNVKGLSDVLDSIKKNN